MRDPILFGDYRTALSDTEPRIYEDIMDYDASKAMFQVLSDYKLSLTVKSGFDLIFFSMSLKYKERPLFELLAAIFCMRYTQ